MRIWPLASTRHAQDAQSSRQNKAVKLNKGFEQTREPWREAFQR